MKKIILIMLFSVFLLSAMTVPSLSQATVGVSVGDWFLYDTAVLNWTASPDVPIPPDQYTGFLVTYNESDWERFTVTDITGNVVTFEVVTHWKNGTETTVELTIDDITSDQQNFWVIPANLDEGDLLRDEFVLFDILYYPPRYLNESIMMDYETETRETNVLDFEEPTVVPEDSIHSRMLWDKETGVLVRDTTVWNNTSANYQKYFVITDIKLIQLSVWVIPEYPTWTVMLLVFVAVTVSINLYIRKRLRH